MPAAFEVFHKIRACTRTCRCLAKTAVCTRLGTSLVLEFTTVQPLWSRIAVHCSSCIIRSLIGRPEAQAIKVIVSAGALPFKVVILRLLCILKFHLSGCSNLLCALLFSVKSKEIMWKRTSTKDRQPERPVVFGSPTLFETNVDSRILQEAKNINNSEYSISSRPAFGRKHTSDVLKGLPALPL